MPLVAGVDGARSGWVAVVLEDETYADAVIASDLAALVTTLERISVIGIDIPIGLPDTKYREADVQARQFVGPRRNSVFMTPPRAVWEAADYAEARQVSVSLTGVSVSAQAFALRSKVLEADALARTDPRLREVHPEVSFAAMAGAHLASRKTSWNGMVERRWLLEREGIDIPEPLGLAGEVGADDVLDAGAAAWSAARIAAGGAVSLPAVPTPGPDGLVAAIWY